MTTYIPHEAKLESYNKEGELVYTKTNYTGTKRSDETTWYKNPGTNSSVRESIFVDREGKKYQERKVITMTESETGVTTQIATEDGHVLSTDELTNTADGWYRIVNHPQGIVQKEIQSNTVRELDGTTKADVMTFDHVEIDPNGENAPYITATRDKLIRTNRNEDGFEDRAVNGIVTDYEYNVHMKFHARDVDTTTAEIKKNAEPYNVNTEITKILTHYEGIPLITKRTKTSIDLGAYNTTTYCNRVRITDADVAEHKVAQAIGIFFETVNGIGGLGHDGTFDEGYIKIDYDQIKYMFVYATYQEDLVSVTPQVKRITMIFTGADKKTAYLKLSGCIVYDTGNVSSHVNVKCTYYTYDDYSVNRNQAFTESYQFETDTILLAKMKLLTKRVCELANAHKHVAELTSKLSMNFVKNDMTVNINGLSILD